MEFDIIPDEEALSSSPGKKTRGYPADRQQLDF